MMTTFYVRGGLDHRLDAPTDRDEYVQAILRDRSVSQAIRVEAATATIRGWAQHHDAPTDPPIWFRYLAAAGSFPATQIEVK